MTLIHGELSEQILGCCVRVHRQLGLGFREKISGEALGLELAKVGLNYERQKAIVINYDEKSVGEHRLDLLVKSKVVVELKACSAIGGGYLAPARSDLKATGLQLARVVNFARPTLDIERVVLTN